MSLLPPITVHLVEKKIVGVGLIKEPFVKVEIQFHINPSIKLESHSFV